MALKRVTKLLAIESNILRGYHRGTYECKTYKVTVNKKRKEIQCVQTTVEF